MHTAAVYWNRRGFASGHGCSPPVDRWSLSARLATAWRGRSPSCLSKRICLVHPPGGVSLPDEIQPPIRSRAVALLAGRTFLSVADGSPNVFNVNTNSPVLTLSVEWGELVLGFDLLGWVHFPHHRVLRTASKRRMLSRLHRYRTAQTLASYRGLLRHGNTHTIQSSSGLLPMASLY